MVVISYLNVANITVAEITSITGSSFVVLGVILRQFSKLKKGVEYQIRQTKENTKEIEKLRDEMKKGSKPVKEALAKLDTIVEKNGG